MTHRGTVFSGSGHNFGMTTLDTSGQMKSAASYWHRQFQLQSDTNDSLRSQLRKSIVCAQVLRQALIELRALHRESMFMTDVPFCQLCVERWPCKSEVILSRQIDVFSQTTTKGDS